jgi:hypothetical protein
MPLRRSGAEWKESKEAHMSGEHESGTVTLTWHEVLMANAVGGMRQLSAVKAGKQDRHGYDGAGWSEHIEGACGEIAVAKLLGVFWDGSVNTWKANDLPGLQVRTRSRHDFELLVRPQDDDSTPWVLVTGKCPEYRVRGYLYGHEAKRGEWLRSYGGRPKAYFVPHSNLRPMEELHGR